MNTFLVNKGATALCLVVVVILQASLVKSQTKYQCKGHEITLSQKTIDTMKKCGEQVGVKSMEELTPQKIPCMAKCMMETSGLVDGEGKPHKENIMKHIDEGTPADMRDIYKKEIEKCIDDHGNKINSKDTDCKSYAPMAMCIMGAVETICRG